MAKTDGWQVFEDPYMRRCRGTGTRTESPGAEHRRKSTCAESVGLSRQLYTADSNQDIIRELTTARFNQRACVKYPCQMLPPCQRSNATAARTSQKKDPCTGETPDWQVSSAITPVIETTDAVKLRRPSVPSTNGAPFHRQRNGIDDAILIKTYADCIGGQASAGARFAFITHNTKDFSHPAASNMLPNSDIAADFSRVKSVYFITLGEALRRIEPLRFADLMIEQEWVEEPRRLTEIVDATDRLTTQVWYNRQESCWRIERGAAQYAPLGRLRVGNDQGQAFSAAMGRKTGICSTPDRCLGLRRALESSRTLLV
jgi:hypothetical protein